VTLLDSRQSVMATAFSVGIGWGPASPGRSQAASSDAHKAAKVGRERRNCFLNSPSFSLGTSSTHHFLLPCLTEGSLAASSIATCRAISSSDDESDVDDSEESESIDIIASIAAARC
jgi:hypothetical protein